MLLVQSDPIIPHSRAAVEIILSLAVGLVVGLEREWAHKAVGVRTFALTALLGTLAAVLAPALLVGALAGVLVFVVLLNAQSLLHDGSLELTTSAALVIVLLLGALVGRGHYFTATASAVLVTMLLAWKAELSHFAVALRPEEIRGAALLGLLSAVIFPLLPNRTVDPWQLVNPRDAWLTVVVIAGIGFVNYVLLRLYGARGMIWAALLGGLVNSTAAILELARSFVRPELRLWAGEGEAPAPSEPLAAADASGGRAIMLVLIATIAMFARNLVLLALFSPAAVLTAIAPLLAMMLLAALLAYRQRGREGAAAPPQLSSPISLRHVLELGLVFVLLAAFGTLAERHLGGLGFAAVGALGGLVSSAGTTATAGTLSAAGKVSAEMAGVATVLASVASTVVNLPLIYRETRGGSLPRRVARRLVPVAALGLAVLIAELAFRR